ncbi:hypothetical protein AB0436_04285 [Streptomyces sp. NPDC051322]|uniref:hypothetical protein n=1 Tax=Streptomyces sp. NPDC051322 TaxID=3154645 RepID=UPI00344EF4A8
MVERFVRTGPRCWSGTPKVAAYLASLHERGETLPGRRNAAGELEIDWRRLAAVLDSTRLP